MWVRGPPSDGGGRAGCVNLPRRGTRTLCTGAKGWETQALTGAFGDSGETGTIVTPFGWGGVLFLWRNGKRVDNELDGCPRRCPLTSVDDYSLCHGASQVLQENRLKKEQFDASSDGLYCSPEKPPKDFSHSLIALLTFPATHRPLRIKKKKKGAMRLKLFTFHLV